MIRYCLAAVAAILIAPAWAETGVAVLDFELRDQTLTPRSPQDLARTAALKGGLERELRRRGDYRITPVALEAQARAAPGVGYLSDHAESAAALVDPAATDFVVVGVLIKPTYLFSYLRATLVRARDRAVVDDVYVEIKGQPDKVTPRALATLAERLHTSMREGGGL
jgi:hypothetical protein